MDILRCKDIPATPWKNGGGMTQVLARQAPNWRISLASITRDGPYSIFPDTMRHQTIVQGKGIWLRGDTDQMELPFGAGRCFRGATPVAAKLMDGPVKALNVIWDPDTTDVRVAECTKPDRHVPNSNTTFLWFALRGCFVVDRYKVDEGDAVLSTDAHMPTPDAGSRIIAVSLRKTA
ncbi:hypothetical protein E2K80_05885 [Rhodophyticola sp. CCM32]|uniref:HutD/Ves family protein n=1 Tax=Rhodophyticola sp. CCM32 TaxID=2916397 RepID=UPI00107FA73C|nr:HutD family protein [Rhodophyticola sp. CCM32]QBY00325.1 hypothetical protein E2K80_05885 [Rhodophyticola sp. CCM32]